MLTQTEINLIAEEVRPQVIDGAIQKIFETDHHGIVLRIRNPGETVFFFASASPRFGRLHLLEGKPDNVRNAGAFTMLLRKHIAGRRIRSIEVAKHDRIVFFEFDDHSLILELIGRHSNFILCEKDRKIVGALHHGQRIQKGAPYTTPPPLDAGSGTDRWEIGSIALGERSERLAAECGAIEAELTAVELRRGFESQAKRSLKRTRRLVRKIEADLERASGAEESRVFGELLQSAYGKVERGASSVTVENFYDELRPVEIPLDPALTLQVNIDRYFHEYRRMKDASGRIEDRLLSQMELQSELEDFLEELDALPDEELELLRDQPRVTRLLRPKQSSKKRAGKVQTLPYRAFVASSGKPIFVGRSSKHNDALNTKVARGRDVWMHARDWPGSHVLIRLNRGETATSEDLIQAGLLAAHFSKGKNDTLIDVTYTEAKHVRKPKGAPPGLVTIAGGSNLAVRMDAAKLEALMKTETR